MTLEDILKVKMALNKELYEEKVISYEVFKRMQEVLMKRKNLK